MTLRPNIPSLHVIASIGCAAIAVPCFGGSTTVDDFEGYGSAWALSQAWMPLVAGQPAITLNTVSPRSGQAAMSLTASMAGAPVDVARTQFGAVQDWSSFDTLSLWVSRDKSAAAALSTLQVVVASDTGATIAIGDEVATPNAGWARYDVALGEADRSRVGGISIAVRSMSPTDAVVLVDDLALAAVPVVIDTDQTAQPLLGFGAQRWPGDPEGASVLTSLDFTWARIAVGPNWDFVANQPPASATTQQMVDYVAANFNGDFPSRLSEAVSALQHADANGIAVILNQFKIPDVWLTPADRLRSSNIDEFAKYWAAVLTLLDSNGVRPEYVELANEPNGTWNGRITPTNYATLVTLARQELDAAGFTDVKIVGPGLSEMRLNGDYFDALDAAAIAAIDAWSTHTWDDWTDWDSRYAEFRNGVDAVDPAGTKPIFVTEYATSLATFNDVTFDGNEQGGPNPASDSPLFAVEAFRNTIRLMNGGASTFVFWEAADQPWNSLTWGLKDRNGAFRPAINALFPLVSNADGATVLENIARDPTIAAFARTVEDGSERVAVAVHNPRDAVTTRTIAIEGALVAGVHEAWQYSAAGLVAKTADVLVDPLTGDVTIEMDPQSAFTLVLDVIEPGPCVRDFTADGSVDFFDVLAAIARFDSGDASLDRVAPAGLESNDLRAAIEAVLFGCGE